ncbi:MAG: hypothetical protein M3323_03085 [Actinomycetota bacterium]|nr:hypothetical protein [Actinomycetota bacterium]
MEWGPVLQTALGASIVLVATEIAHRHRLREGVSEARRSLYIRFIQHLYRLDRVMVHEREEDPDRTQERELIMEMTNLQAEIDVIGSLRVRQAVERLGAAMAEEYDPAAPHDQHQDAVLHGLRTEGNAVVEAIREEIQPNRTLLVGFLRRRIR